MLRCMSITTSSSKNQRAAARLSTMWHLLAGLPLPLFDRTRSLPQRLLHGLALLVLSLAALTGLYLLKSAVGINLIANGGVHDTLDILKLKITLLFLG